MGCWGLHLGLKNTRQALYPLHCPSGPPPCFSKPCLQMSRGVESMFVRVESIAHQAQRHHFHVGAETCFSLIQSVPIGQESPMTQILKQVCFYEGNSSSPCAQHSWCLYNVGDWQTPFRSPQTMWSCPGRFNDHSSKSLFSFS